MRACALVAAGASIALLPLQQGTSGVTYANEVYPRDAVAALANNDPDYPGSCGRCYEVRCHTGPVIANGTSIYRTDNGFAGVGPLGNLSMHVVTFLSEQLIEFSSNSSRYPCDVLEITVYLAGTAFYASMYSLVYFPFPLDHHGYRKLIDHKLACLVAGAILSVAFSADMHAPADTICLRARPTQRTSSAGGAHLRPCLLEPLVLCMGTLWRQIYCLSSAAVCIHCLFYASITRTCCAA